LLGYRAARKAEVELFTYQARLVATLDRWPKDKYLPSMNELLTPPEPQSVDDMLVAFEEMKKAGAPITITQVS
jgi:hypothetical protein